MIAEIEANRAELETLCRRHHVLRLELFGSAATLRADQDVHDLDFLVEFEPHYTDVYFGLLESLERLFGRPVDLVVGSAIRNPYFRQSVDETKALLYAA
ncbi:MAG: nucleotidyltransferase domain-containing protein [Alphaproteobacteria bacterium]